MVRFVPMQESELMSLYGFAAPIWKECYAAILPQAQIELLLHKYFSPSALLRAVAEGTRYEMILQDGQQAGFIAYRLLDGCIYLDKLYLKPEYRGKHILTKALRYLDAFALPIKLNVNENNTAAQRAYSANGFQFLYKETILLPNGYQNRDLVLQRPYPIRPAQPQDLHRLSAAWRGNAADFAQDDSPRLYPPAREDGTKPQTLVYDDGKVRGFIALNDAVICGLYVPAKYRRVGVAGALLYAAQAKTEKALSATVYPENEHAIQFFLAQSFTAEKTKDGLLTMINKGKAHQ